jgi:outer membrane biogenesis lipoprotein LolB
MYFRRYFFHPWIGLAMVLLLAGSFATARAQNKPQASPALPEMIARANALTDLSAIGPYQLHAQITVNPGSDHEQQGEITIYRNPNGLRTELQLGDFRQVEVFSQEARYVWRSRPYPVIGLETLEGLEVALQLRTAFPPQTKYSQEIRGSVSGVPASCIDARPPFEGKLRFCFDARTGALLEASDSRGWRGRFSEYAAAGNGMFPGRMELTLPGEPRHLEFAQVHVTTQTFDDVRFAQPQGALAFAACNRMAAAVPLAGLDWVILNRQRGEVYLYAIVEADGRVHDLKAYGTNDKRLQREVTKQARSWHFAPARCGTTAVASEVLLPLRQAPEWDYSSGTSSDSYSTSSASSIFDRPQNLNTDINNYINTVTDH